MKRPKGKEGLKTILIIALFFSTMLLLYFNWGYPDMKAFRILHIVAEEEVVEAPAIKDVVQPQNVVVNFGTGTYARLGWDQFDSWNECIATLSLYSRGNMVLVEEITPPQYDKIMDLRSVRFGFQYDIPFSSFCRHYDIASVQGFGQIETFREIGYSLGSPESLFIADENKGKYYRIVSGEQVPRLGALINAAEKGDYIICYPIGTFVGTEGKAIIPITFESRLAGVGFEPELQNKNGPRIREFAEIFFGESFDFVRRIEESKGTLIYMYGYGGKVLTINPDGSAEYKEKTGAGGGQQDYFESLACALQFVASHGGFDSKGDCVPYLKESRAVEKDKRKGHVFVFGMRVTSESLYHIGSEIISVEIIGGQVSNYKRNMISLNGHTETAAKEAYSAINMLAKNYHYINSVLSGEGYKSSQERGEALFDYISERIQLVKTGYVRPIDGNELIPSFVVVIEDITFYFDLFDVEPLGYNKSGGI